MRASNDHEFAAIITAGGFNPPTPFFLSFTHYLLPSLFSSIFLSLVPFQFQFSFVLHSLFFALRLALSRPLDFFYPNNGLYSHQWCSTITMNSERQKLD